MPEASTKAAQTFDLGSFSNNLVSTLGDVGKTYIVAEAANSGAKTLAGAGTTGVYLAAIAVAGLLGVGVLLVILKK